MHAIVLSFDRLHLGYLGPYGNDWIETPQLNRLATDSVVFDQCLGEARSPDDPAHGWWQLDALRSHGVRRLLVTDTPVAVKHFDRTLNVSGKDGPDHPEAESTIAKLLSEAGRQVESLARETAPTLVWVRSRGIARPWLPSKELVDLYFEEFRLTASREDEETDLEVLHQSGRESDLPYIRAMYAACVTSLDRWLVRVMKPFAKLPQPPLVILTAAAGEELGEHGEPGTEFDDPYSPNVHVPLLIHWPGAAEGRRQALVTCADVSATLCEWFGVAAPPQGKSLGPVLRQETEDVRQELAISTPESLGLRTAETYYIRPRNVSPTDLHESAEVFDKPSDRWDLANLAMLSPGLVDELEARLAKSRLVVQREKPVVEAWCAFGPTRKRGNDTFLLAYASGQTAFQIQPSDHALVGAITGPARPDRRAIIGGLPRPATAFRWPGWGSLHRSARDRRVVRSPRSAVSDSGA